MSTFLPFARKKRNDFWVWDLMADIFPDDDKIQLACLCKALSCKTQNEFLINTREKLVMLLLDQHLYNEAKVEVKTIIETRNNNGWKIPAKLSDWEKADWFTKAEDLKNNRIFYNKHKETAEEILYHDTPEQIAVVEFVNADKKILNFIINKSKYGFFKYDRFLDYAQTGEVIKIRLEEDPKANSQINEGKFYKALSVRKVKEEPDKEVLRSFEGAIRKNENQSFAFVDDIFIEPSLVKTLALQDNTNIAGQAIISFNKKKDSWGWKAIGIKKLS